MHFLKFSLVNYENPIKYPRYPFLFLKITDLKLVQFIQTMIYLHTSANRVEQKTYCGFKFCHVVHKALKML